MVWTDELDMSRGKAVATGAMVVGTVLAEMIWGSTLETPEGVSLSEIPGSVVRERAMTRGRRGIVDGALGSKGLSR